VVERSSEGGLAEVGTSKFCAWLENEDDPLGALSWCSTAEYAQEAPLLSIAPVDCDRGLGIVWGTVPATIAMVEAGAGRPDGIETIAGISEFGDVRFVLGRFEEPYPTGAGVTYLDASGLPVDMEWPTTSGPRCRP